ncbi:SPOR domain-containing protein [Wukongibacter baidiensis]|uniref:SPOR domain-containing protein n=1 Tax=Wukongibacter baidiensis TaxID=1723361 RepID=UPI003D7F903A
MRRNRTKTRKSNNNNIVKILGAIALLCVLAISIGYFGTKYFIIPKYLTSQNTSASGNTTQKKVDLKPQKNVDNEKTPASNGTEGSKETNETKETASNNEGKEQTAEKKLYSLEVPPLNIFNIQVGSFDNKAHAETQVKNLKDKGLSGYIVESDRYRVMVMSFVQRESADKYKNSIKDVYADAFISPKQLPTREVNYGESGKGYSEVASKQIKELKKYYESYSSFLANNDINTLETSKITQFVDSQINSLDGIAKSISTVSPSDDFKNFNSKFNNIVTTAKTKLTEAKKSNFSDRTKLFEIFMESLNSFEGII